MTNAEAAIHFASMPADKPAEVLVINGTTSSAESLTICEPGTNLDEVEEDFLNEGDEKLATAYTN